MKNTPNQITPLRPGDSVPAITSPYQIHVHVAGKPGAGKTLLCQLIQSVLLDQPIEPGVLDKLRNAEISYFEHCSPIEV